MLLICCFGIWCHVSEFAVCFQICSNGFFFFSEFAVMFPSLLSCFWLYCDASLNVLLCFQICWYVFSLLWFLICSCGFGLLICFALTGYSQLYLQFFQLNIHTPVGLFSSVRSYSHSVGFQRFQEFMAA